MAPENGTMGRSLPGWPRQACLGGPKRLSGAVLQRAMFRYECRNRVGTGLAATRDVLRGTAPLVAGRDRKPTMSYESPHSLLCLRFL
jgi:hypothetical protein